LLHELAHLRRWDDWTNLAQKVVKALFFFHPAVWWIEKKASLEREMACDDAVLAETTSARAYAECLAHLAEKTLIQRSVALAQAALGRVRQTSLRVARILDVNRPKRTVRAWKPAVSLVAGFAIVCVLGISRGPKLIAFSDSNLGSVAVAQDAHVAMEMPIAKVQATNAMFQDQQVRVVPARVNSKAVRPRLRTYNHPSQMPSVIAGRVGSVALVTNVGLRNTSASQSSLAAGSFTPIAFTETFFVLIEGSKNGSPDQPVYQIQLWRLTVLHAVVDPESRIPRKEI
jgi:hypothetical protein